MLAAIIAIIAMVGLDQLVKYWAFNFLQKISTIPLINGVFHLTYVENRGAAFSILQNKIWFFAIATVIILAIIVWAIKTEKVKTNLGRWSLYIIIGGALGNFIDRVIRGFVVDMFDFRLINFPVFNIADIFVCIGGLLFCIYVLFYHDKESK